MIPCAKLCVGKETPGLNGSLPWALSCRGIYNMERIIFHLYSFNYIHFLYEKQLCSLAQLQRDFLNDKLKLFDCHTVAAGK